MEALERRIGGHLITTSYVVEVGGARVEIDPGPPNAYSPSRADYALCTHIHNDHCGAAGHVGVPVYVHGRYADHVANPAKLWEATKRALGPIAEIFGEPRPAAEVKPLKDGERLFDAIDVYFTPGHAPHHVMFYYRDEGALFVEERAGVYFPQVHFTIPVSPPPFHFEEYIA
ncbi:MAG: MBL fold metallo-hydrolase [Thermoproteus sp.]|nr:MBL fold metallo-hydrolase [Thermoproteus sp.]